MKWSYLCESWPAREMRGESNRGKAWSYTTGLSFRTKTWIQCNNCILQAVLWEIKIGIFPQLSKCENHFTQQQAWQNLIAPFFLFLLHSFRFSTRGALTDKWIVHQSSLQCAPERCPRATTTFRRWRRRRRGVKCSLCQPKAPKQEVLQADWRSAKPPAESHPSVCILCKWVT